MLLRLATAMLVAVVGCASAGSSDIGQRRTDDATTAITRPTPKEQRAALREELKQHVIQKASYWAGFKATPLAERCREPTPEVLDYIAKDNLVWGLSQVPSDPQLPAAFKQDVVGALATLPAPVKALINDWLMSVFVVKDLGSSAYSEVVITEQGESVGGFIILDHDVLNQPANAWATWKENDPFRATTSIKIDVTIEDAEHDTRLNAIRFIVLHELGHLIAATAPFPIHPRIGSYPSSDQEASFPYYRESWSSHEHKYVSRWDANFPERAGVAFYLGPKSKTDAPLAIPIYRKLSTTNFPSLYGATSPYDDFAEGFATYVHTVIDKRPYRVRVFKNDELAAELVSCWDQPRCESKRQILERLLLQTP